MPEFAKNTSVERTEVKELLIEHIKIRSLVSEICEDNKSEKLAELGDLLRGHIRKEEQVVFPMVESELTKVQLELT